MSKAEYKRLGDFIREVNVRNRELKVTKLVGLTIDKTFIPSVANVIGTDLSTYKIIRKEQFACSLMQVSRDGKMPIAMFTEDEAIMSPAYPIFEIINKNVLLPQYLMMWLARSEFDREASYYAVGGVRGSLTWEDFCNMKLPIPTIERQCEIVNEYKTLSHRIRLNEQMIKTLEDTAQALYRKMFVDNIEKENLPDGWRMGTLTDIATYLNGTACQKYETKEKEHLPVLKIRELSQGHCDDSSDHVETSIPSEYIIDTGDVIFSWSATLLIDVWCGGKCALNQHLFKVSSPRYPKWFYFLWTHYHISEWRRLISAKATSMGHIKREDLESAQVIIPPDNVMGDLNNKMHPIFEMYILKKQENLKLTDLQSLLLAKMGQ
jgi:hypothetical protein